MKQKLLLILICLLGISNVDAQVCASPGKNAKFSASPVKITGQQLRAADADGLIYFGYSDDDIQTNVGVSATAELSAAICMPASLSSLYTGRTITKIRIGLAANCTNVSVWIRNALDGSNLVSKVVGNANQGWTEVSLSTPFTIPNSDFYIGYTATGLQQIGFSGQSASDGAWLWYNGWDNYSGYGWGSLCIQGGIDAQGATVLYIGQESMQNRVQSAPNQNFTIPCSIKSLSSVDITSVKVTYQISGQSTVERTISTSIAPMKTGSFQIPVDAIAANGIYSISARILEINGQPNNLANQYLYANIRILSQPFPRKVVMEEKTGTWCPWCVRGAVGLAMMNEKYPDTFIGIAVHGGSEDEPMMVADYDNYMGHFTGGFPSMVIDRKRDLMGDPYFDADNFYQSEMEKTPLAGIQLTGGFIDNSKQAILLKATATFGLSFNNANYKLAYVLVENGVTGYSQYNAYAGSGIPMGGYENKPGIITDMVFNDVARGIYSDPAGTGGSIPAVITEMKPIEHSLMINVPSSVQNKNQLEAVVMLLDANTGEIENSSKIAINSIISIDVPATGISLDKSSCTIAVGGAVQLKATVVPANATINIANWKSSNPAVATVSASGLVTAVDKGTATITATTYNGISATCAVTIGTANPDFEVVNGVLTAYHGAGGDVVIPDNLGIMAIGDWVFYNFTGLTSVTIPNSVISIGDYAFAGCRGLTSITIPNSVISIGNAAFESCTGLTSVTIGNSVTSIGNYAFYYCYGLTSVTIPNSVTSIGICAFTDCTGVTAIEVDNANPSYLSENGVLFDKGKKTLICYPAGKSGSYIIPNSVTSIRDYAFDNCYGLTSVTIPGSVTSIGDWAFYNCFGLTSVTIGKSVTSIGDYAFDYCTGLTSVTCYAVKPPRLVTGWDGNSYTFDNVNLPNCILYVPTGSKALYQAAKVWKDFGSIVEQNLTSIPNLTANISVYLNNGKLYVDSPIAENIQVYSTEGTLLNGFQKPAGNASYPVETTNGSVLIVKGSSGWVKKVIYSKK